MKSIKQVQLLSVLVLGLGVTPAFAAEDAAKIISPTAGAKVPAGVKSKISYDVTIGARGDHAHLYVDGKEAAILRKPKDERNLKKLAAGAHEICVKVVDSGHTPIGAQDCVKVTAE